MMDQVMGFNEKAPSVDEAFFYKYMYHFNPMSEQIPSARVKVPNNPYHPFRQAFQPELMQFWVLVYQQQHILL
jgi:hypothetical protein